MRKLTFTRWKENVDLGMTLGRATMEHCLDVKII